MPSHDPMYPPGWSTMAGRVLDRDDWTCRRCGESADVAGYTATALATAAGNGATVPDYVDDNLEALCRMHGALTRPEPPERIERRVMSPHLAAQTIDNTWTARSLAAVLRPRNE